MQLQQKEQGEEKEAVAVAVAVGVQTQSPESGPRSPWHLDGCRCRLPRGLAPACRLPRGIAPACKQGPRFLRLPRPLLQVVVLLMLLLVVPAMMVRQRLCRQRSGTVGGNVIVQDDNAMHATVKYGCTSRFPSLQ